MSASNLQPAVFATDKRYSYSSVPMGVASRAEELLHLTRAALRPVSSGVDHTIETVRITKARVLEFTGVRVQGLRVLEIGPGQCPQRLRCLSLTNEAVGIDTDIIPQGARLGDYWDMVRHGPPMRSIKTLGRKLLARDARCDVVLMRKLGVSRLPALRLLRMNASHMSFPDASFGFACSYSVFEHIDEPAAAMREVARVLAPGGVAYISLHLYTSHSGQHDPQIFAQGGAPQAPLWPHLRPEFQNTITPSTYLNRLRLGEWRALFQREMPGVHFIYEQQPEIAADLADLHKAGELAEYSDEELLTLNLIAIWKKPS
jgi:SAM-dependent methyltransferase